jgi:hypothetical protein
MPAFNNDTVLIFFVAMAGVAFLVQAVVAIALYVSMRRATTSLREQIDDLRGSIVPVFQASRQIIERIAPRIEPLTNDISRIAANVKIASGDMVEIAEKLKAEADAVQASAAEVMERVRLQTLRVDGMVTGVLDAADRAGDMMHRAVTAPVRQISGVLAAVKAIVDVLRAPGAAPRSDHSEANRSEQDKDMFV